MSSRRPVINEKTLLESQGGPPESARPASNIHPAVPAPVIYKLIFFTLAMIILPIGTFFLTVHSIFKGNSTLAGALAAVMANVVLVGYIIAAVREDQSDKLEAEAEERRKKGQ